MAYLSIHVHPKEASLDAAIVRWFGLFNSELHGAAPGFTDYFFTRSLDGGPHLRLRLRGPAKFFEEVATPIIVDVFEKKAGAALSVEPFEPEVARFGGSGAYESAESYFAASSQAAFMFLCDAEGDYNHNLGAALQMHAAVAHAAGFTQKEASAYFNQLSIDWVPAFFKTDGPLFNGEREAFFGKVFDAFEEGFERQAAEVRPLVARFWEGFGQKKGDPVAARWLKINQTLLPNIPPSAWPDLMHLTNNRLGITNQDEPFVFYCLARGLVG